MQNGYSHESSIPDTSESVSTSSDDLTGPSSIKSEHPLAQNQIDGQQSIKEDRPATPHSPSMRETTGSPTSASNSTAPFVMRDSSWLELETCREFLRGDCIRDDCRYAHPAANVVIKDGKVVCCFDYLKDRCTRERCKYLHPSQSIKERLVQAGKQYGHAMALTTQPPKQPMSAIPPMPLGGAISMSAMGYPPGGYQVPIPTSPVSSGMVNKIDVCRDYDRGRCNREDRCHFAHPEPYVRRNPDNTVTVCWNFMQGYCRHEMCWFFHPPPFLVNLISLMSPVTSPLLQPLMVPGSMFSLSGPISPPLNMPGGIAMHPGVSPLLSPVLPAAGIPTMIPPGVPAPVNLVSMQ